MSTTSAVILIIVIADLCFMFFVVRAIVSSNYGPLADDFPSDEIRRTRVIAGVRASRSGF